MPAADAVVLADEAGTGDYFDATVAAGAPLRLATTWVMGDLIAHCKASANLPKSTYLDPANLDGGHTQAGHCLFKHIVQQKGVVGSYGDPLTLPCA